MPVAMNGLGLTLHLWGAYSPHWNTKYTGVLFKTTTNSTWKWESFSFSSVSQTSGQMAPCFDADVSSNVSTTISGDKITALAAGDYSVTVKCTCLAGTRIGSPWVNQLDNYDHFNATVAATQ